MQDQREMTVLAGVPSTLETLAGRQVFTTEQLFGSANEIALVHQGQTYRLRITRQGKLVLNK